MLSRETKAWSFENGGSGITASVLLPHVVHQQKGLPTPLAILGVTAAPPGTHLDSGSDTRRLNSFWFSARFLPLLPPSCSSMWPLCQAHLPHPRAPHPPSPLVPIPLVGPTHGRLGLAVLQCASADGAGRMLSTPRTWWQALRARQELSAFS